MPATRKHSGFTLVEILVVIAIIGILLSLTLSHLGSGIAAARRVTCEKQLATLAEGMHLYEGSKGELPGYCQSYGQFSGGIDPGDPGSFGGAVPEHRKIGSWQVAMLPYIGAQPLFERWSMDRYPLLAGPGAAEPPTPEGYSAIVAANTAGYICPSAVPTLANKGRNNYVANTGMHCNTFPFTYTRPGGTPQSVSWLDSMSRSNGMFTNRYAGFDPSDSSNLVPIGEPFRFDDCKDGASNTLMLSENQQAQPWHIVRLTGNATHLTSIVSVGGKEVVQYPTESRYLQGVLWHFEDPSLFAGAPPVDPLHKINGGDVSELLMTSTNLFDVARPSSLHAGGVVAAMADGHIEFITESIDYEAYQAMMTPRGSTSDMPNNEFLSTTGL